MFWIFKTFSEPPFFPLHELSIARVVLQPRRMLLIKKSSSELKFCYVIILDEVEISIMLTISLLYCFCCCWWMLSPRSFSCNRMKLRKWKFDEKSSNFNSGSINGLSTDQWQAIVVIFNGIWKYLLN